MDNRYSDHMVINGAIMKTYQLTNYLVCKYCGEIVNVALVGGNTRGICSNAKCGGYWVFLPVWHKDIKTKEELKKSNE